MGQIDLTLVRDALTIAADHLVQLRRHSEAMRVTGRGCSISSPYSDGLADRLVREALRALSTVRPNGSEQYRANVLQSLDTQIANYEG